MAVVWRLWIGALVLMNLISPLLFIDRSEARFVIAFFLAQGLLMYVLFELQGFTRLLGLAHFGWFGLIWFLWPHLPRFPADTPLGLWLRALLVLNAVSLAIDVMDVIRYARGERAEPGKP